MGTLWNATTEDYKGLKMRCAPGLHAAAADMLACHPEVPRDGVLDLASGSGALLARLRDQGFTDLAAVELDAPKFMVDGVRPMALDLNGPFERELPRQYRLVTAIEIVEHLDSPRHFLRSIHESLEDAGYLLISTPNIAAWRGRLKFLLTGVLRHFDEGQYEYNHHVSPVPHLQMLQILRETGFQRVDHATAGSFSGPLKKVVGAPFHAAIRSFFGSGAVGDVNLYLARKTFRPNRNLPTDWTPQQ